jgi:hypothetical protein
LRVLYSEAGLGNSTKASPSELSVGRILVMTDVNAWNSPAAMLPEAGDW